MLEVECPICDHKIGVDEVRCPNCNADFSVSGVDELQKVARELKEPVAAERPSTPPKVPATPEAPISEASKVLESADQKKNGLLGKFFKKKK